MQASLIVALALTGVSPTSLSDGRPLTAVPWQAEELREQFRDTLQRVRKEATFDAVRDVPDLLVLRHALTAHAGLSRVEQVRMRQRVDYWLEESYKRLKHRQRHLKSDGHTTATMKTAAGLPAGGAAEARAVAQLISLIEATVEPESWLMNGGRGTIRYYAPLQVLVIRNTQQVHDELGGVLHQMRDSAR